MTEIPGTLYHKKCVEIIGWVNRPKWGMLKKKGLPIDVQKGYLRITEKGLSLRFKHHLSKATIKKISPGKTLTKVEFHTSNHLAIVLDGIFLGTYSPPEFTGSITSWQTKGYSKKRSYHFKMFIPLSKKLQFHYQVEVALFESDLGIHSRNATVAMIDGVEIIACILQKKDMKHRYLSIESRAKLGFNSFNSKAHSVKNALGYLTGYLAGETAYYFAFDSLDDESPRHYVYWEIRHEIKSGYQPVYSNPSGWTRDKRAADWFREKKLLRELHGQEFSALCQALHDDVEFTSTVLLILESSVASLLFMPGGFAIALEMISDIVMGDKKVDLKPVQEKKLSRAIRDDCLGVIQKYEAQIGVEAAKIFSNKIRGLNQVTNRARLKAPFELLGITLLPEDLEILETRNDFLHGRAPDITKMGPGRSLDRVNNDLYYSAMRLYTLLNMIILKWIGYDNYVVNYPKVQEAATGIRLREQYYRKV